MKTKVSKYEYIETLIEDVEIEIPETPFAFQEWNHRTLIMVKPQWTKWNVERYNKPEEIWKLDILVVHTDRRKIEHTSLSVHRQTLEHLLTSRGVKNKDWEDSIRIKILDYIMSLFGNDSISLETFKAGYKNVVREINETMYDER
jgi:hypothetical protein